MADRVLTSPAVRRLAKDYGISLAKAGSRCLFVHVFACLAGSATCSTTALMCRIEWARRADSAFPFCFSHRAYPPCSPAPRSAPPMCGFDPAWTPHLVRRRWRARAPVAA